jgi:hypothetical protein
VVDSCSVRAVFGGQRTGPNPTDRAKLGSKRHLICDGRGVPLAIQLTGANRNDSQQALALIDAIQSLQGERGRPRHRPACVMGWDLEWPSSFQEGEGWAGWSHAKILLHSVNDVQLRLIVRTYLD